MPMGSPRIVSAWYLIGRARVRRSWTGRMVLQVAEGRRHGFALPRGPRYDEWIEVRWRDATIYDLKDINTGQPIDNTASLPKPTPRPWADK